MKTYRLIYIPVLIAFAGLLFSACSKPDDARTTPVTATTPDEFSAWKNKLAQKIEPSEMKELDSCINEISVGIQQRKEASGQEAIAWKLCEYVNGKTYREVLVMGYEATIKWVPKELEFQRGNLEKTMTAINGPGSDAAKSGLRDFYKQAMDNYQKLEARLRNAETRLGELKAQATKYSLTR